MANINDMLATTTSTTSTSRALTGTARLSSIAREKADEFIRIANTDAIDNDELLSALRDNDKLDALIKQYVSLAIDGEDADFFWNLGDTAGARMLKSQQSKRSRLKSKDMTASNFSSLMEAAIAEAIVRNVYGFEKHAAGTRQQVAMYSDEELDALAADQEALKRAIRNVQSRKSIMKSKAGFDANSDAWQQLLELEASLKSRREVTNRGGQRVDATKQALRDLLVDADTSKMTKQQLLELIACIQGLTA